MKRWNGWGEENVSVELSTQARNLLGQWVGIAEPHPDFSFEEMLQLIPPTRLRKAHPLISTQQIERLRHARGQSFPDWLALRSGNINSFPDGVAHPRTEDDIVDLLKYAKETGTQLIPYGGGTSVVGHLTPQGEKPILTVSMREMSHLHRFDAESQLATFGAGITGPRLENLLQEKGYTLGHFPQSFEYSTLGGWVVTRSSGQQSLAYGRIEDLFAGGVVITPQGKLDLPSFPASAAGPDLRHLVLGSEGRIGFLTEATVRVSRLPKIEQFHAVFFPFWEKAIEAVRMMSQADVSLSMMRLSSSVETQTNLALSPKAQLIKRLKPFLELRGIREEGCLLLVGFTGERAMVRASKRKALSICRASRGVHLFQALGNAWRAHRFQGPYLRNTLWDLGYGADTLETSVTWEKITPTLHAIEHALRNGLNDLGEKVHVFTHLSHFYSSGSSIYTTYIFRLASTSKETLVRWRRLKSLASEAIVKAGGTISHQHGVGLDHAPYLAHEKSPLGLSALSQVCQHFDPDHLLNPGKLLL